MEISPFLSEPQSTCLPFTYSRGMLKCLTDGLGTIRLPHTLNASTMYAMIGEAITQSGDSKFINVTIDFLNLQQIGPVGVVVLSNLIEYLRLCGAGGTLTGLVNNSDAVKYLDMVGFFEDYNNKRISPALVTPDTLLSLTRVPNVKRTTFLQDRLMPWVAKLMNVSPGSLGSFRVGVEEVLQNIGHHSTIDVGCAHGALVDDEIILAISDFGVGIPENVRSVEGWHKDGEAIKRACDEGFTSTGNKIRGAGLGVLLKTMTSNGRGRVSITSGAGQVSAIHLPGGGYRLTARQKSFIYPGTLIEIALKLGSFEGLSQEVEAEEFSW